MTAGRKIALAWLALIVMGLASLLVNANLATARWTFAVVIAVAGAKAMIVAWTFMQIGAAPRGWRMAFSGVIAAIAATVAILHFFAA